jgi:hypothetical protein
MAPIPLKAQAGIAALTFAVATLATPRPSVADSFEP